MVTGVVQWLELLLQTLSLKLVLAAAPQSLAVNHKYVFWQRTTCLSCAALFEQVDKAKVLTGQIPAQYRGAAPGGSPRGYAHASSQAPCCCPRRVQDRALRTWVTQGLAFKIASHCVCWLNKYQTFLLKSRLLGC